MRYLVSFYWTYGFFAVEADSDAEAVRKAKRLAQKRRKKK